MNIFAFMAFFNAEHYDLACAAQDGHPLAGAREAAEAFHGFRDEHPAFVDEFCDLRGGDLNTAEEKAAFMFTIQRFTTGLAYC